VVGLAAEGVEHRSILYADGGAGVLPALGHAEPV
jgi:hypothetical protein